jgi:hypothetical protein
MYLGRHPNAGRFRIQSVETQEILNGVVDNANTVFTTTHEFISSTLKVYLNGQRIYSVDPYDRIDFTVINSSTIQMIIAPRTDDLLHAVYYRTTDYVVVPV